MTTEHESANRLDNMPTSFPVLSIDAWAYGDDGWMWNMWHKLPYSFPAELLDDNAAIVAWFIENGLLTIGAVSLVYIDDDQYNKVVCASDDHMPLFAVEYGSSF